MTDTAAWEPGPILLRDVALARDGRTILDGITADIPPGRATAVVGPSGAGKSTLLALIAGFDPPDSGTIDNPFPRERMGIVLQAYGLVSLLTAAENVELALQPRGLDRDEIRSRAAEQLDGFGLAALADRQTDELSGGQQQRLAIARALVVQPDLLIADELTSELDPRNREAALSRILGLRERGVTVVLATHDLAVARACDHVVEIASMGTEDRAARTRTAEAAEREQRRRIAAQQEVVRREQARLDDLQRALDRLVAQREQEG